jgi:hypothetical protein
MKQSNKFVDRNEALTYATNLTTFSTARAAMKAVADLGPLVRGAPEDVQEAHGKAVEALANLVTTSQVECGKFLDTVHIT